MGGYIISDYSSGNKPELILIGMGSELEIAYKAAEVLRKEGKNVRVVSFVSWELFDDQSDKYKGSVLPASVTARVSVEAGSIFGWEKIVGVKGKSIGVDHFGANAFANVLYKEFGISVDNVVLLKHGKFYNLLADLNFPRNFMNPYFPKKTKDVLVCEPYFAILIQSPPLGFD